MPLLTAAFTRPFPIAFKPLSSPPKIVPRPRKPPFALTSSSAERSTRPSICRFFMFVLPYLLPCSLTRVHVLVLSERDVNALAHSRLHEARPDRLQAVHDPT